MRNKRIFLLVLVTLFIFNLLSFAEKAEPYYDYRKGEVIIKFHTQKSAKALQEFMTQNNLKLKKKSPFIDYYLFTIEETRAVPFEVKRLGVHPDVKYSGYNYICHKHLIPNDTYWNYQHGMRQINMPTAWNLETGNSSILIAVLDTGIDLDNVDLVANIYSSGYDSVNSDFIAEDDEGHGSHVAGIIAAVTNNGYGVSGVAHDCSLLPVKVLDHTGSGDSYTLSDGIVWATNQGADVINMSLGWPVIDGVAYTPSPEGPIKDAIAHAYNNKVAMFASSGNDGEPAVAYPAAYQQVISVGAVTKHDIKTDYSNWGDNLDIVAPGGDSPPTENLILSTYPADAFYWMGGTSQSCPHAAGVGALVIARGATSPESVRYILQISAIDLGDSGRDDMYGDGRIDAYRALLAAKPDQVYNLTNAYNFPNPFKRKTTIIFTVNSNQSVKVTIYDDRLNKIDDFSVDAKAGQNNSIIWDATGYGNNVYFIKLEGPDGERVIKAVKAE